MSTTSKQSWQRLIDSKRNDLVGGDIEHHGTPEGVLRGPITSIEIEGDKLVITTEWTAHMPTNSRGLPTGDWQKVTRAGATEFRYDLVEIDGVSVTSAPQSIGDGRFAFTYPFNRIVIFPKGGSQLAPSRVQGL